MNKIKNRLLAMIFILPVLFIAPSCSDDDDNGWTDEQRTAFIESCVEDDEGDNDTCECIYNGYSSNWTYEESQNLGLEDLGTIFEIATDCAL